MMVCAHARMHPGATKHDLSLYLIFMSLYVKLHYYYLVLGLLLLFLFETHARIHRLTHQ